MSGTVDVLLTGDTATLRVRGEVDLVIVPRLHDAVVETLQASCRLVVLDLARVSFIDCAGVAALIGCCDDVRAGGARVQLAAASSEVTRMLALTDTVDRVTLTAPA